MDTDHDDAAQRVVVCDDHALIRESVAKVVQDVPGLTVQTTVSSDEELRRVLGTTPPDILVLDIGLGGADGLEVAAAVRRNHPDVRILMLSMHDGDTYLKRALAIEVAGYVHKSSPTRELRHGLEAVRDGDTYVDSSLTRRALDVLSGRADDGPGALTERELEVLVLLARGRRPTEIADDLFLSVKTIKNHLTHVYEKLHVDSAAQAVAEAYRRGIVTPDG